MNVLIADDSVVMRKIMAKYVESAWVATIDQANDGAEALDLAMAKPFDLILLDWNMPKLLGIDILRRLRGAGMTMPIVIVTTEANRSAVIKAVRAGANNFIMKPFQKETFLSRLQQTLDKAPPPE